MNTRLRIGTWNVEYAAGANKNARRLEVLQANLADIWVLTETHDDLSLAPKHTPVHSLQRPTGRAGGRWTSIWSRYPIVRQIDTTDGERTVSVLVDAPVGLLLIYGTVLPWH